MPSGKGYDRCRSVHSEQNAMLSAARKDMIGATLYLVGINSRNKEYVTDNWPCTFCKRMLINAGIKEVVMRQTKTEYRIEQVKDWIENDDSLEYQKGKKIMDKIVKTIAEELNIKATRSRGDYKTNR